MTEKTKCILTTLAAAVIAITAFVCSFDVLAVGKEYKGGTKPFECTNPIKKEDGTDIGLGEIETAYMQVTKDKIFGSPLMIVTMPGGCTRIEDVDVTSLGFGQFYLSASVLLTGGEVSSFAADLPFVLKSAANPLPPVVVE